MLENLEKFRDMKDFDKLITIIERKLGMSLEEAANMEVKSKSETELSSWMGYDCPPMNHWVDDYDSAGDLFLYAAFWAPTYGVANCPADFEFLYNNGRYIRWENWVSRYDGEGGSPLSNWSEPNPPTGNPVKLTPTRQREGNFVAPGKSAWYIHAWGKIYSSPNPNSLIVDGFASVFYYAATKGDADYDGDIDDNDLAIIVNYILGVYPNPDIFHGYRAWAADCDGNGDYNTPDLLYVINMVPYPWYL